MSREGHDGLDFQSEAVDLRRKALSAKDTEIGYTDKAISICLSAASKCAEKGDYCRELSAHYDALARESFDRASEYLRGALDTPATPQTRWAQDAFPIKDWRTAAQIAQTYGYGVDAARVEAVIVGYGFAADSGHTRSASTGETLYSPAACMAILKLLRTQSEQASDR